MNNRPVVYFSAEFGLHESLPIYSGGLGMLAGDHLKSASDMGIPLIGIGLLYQQGYFTQRLNKDGWQEEDYTDLDLNNVPLQPVKDPSGQPLIVRVDTRSSPAVGAGLASAGGQGASAASRFQCGGKLQRGL